MPTKLVATAASLERSKKNNSRSFIYGQWSTNPANFVKNGPVDIEIIGLTEITENLYLKQQQNVSPPPVAVPRWGGGTGPPNRGYASKFSRSPKFGLGPQI